MSIQIILTRMEHLSLETKAIIFAIGFVAVIIIGLIMDHWLTRKTALVMSIILLNTVV